MSIADALAHSAERPAGRRPYFLDAQVERSLAITLAIAQELAVTRERLDTVERLLEQHSIFPQAAIESFAPTSDAAVTRSIEMQAFLTRVLRIVQQEGEAIVSREKPRG